MTENEVSVKIVGDASKVPPATDAAKTEVLSLKETVAQLTATMQEMSAKMVSGMERAAAATDHARAEVHKLHEESESGFGGMIGRIHEGAESIRTMQMRAKEFAELYVAMFAVERVKEFTEQMAEAAEKTKHLAETFGMTVPEVQGLQGVASMTGIAFDKLAQGMAILDKNAVLAARGTGPVAQAFHEIGISANDGRTQMERVMVVADKFKDMADGPNKVALAMELFGKSGRDMIPFLNMGSQGIEELDRKTQEYSAGVLIASDANKQLRDWLEQVNERGVALAESTNETKVAWQGMSNVLTDALAPVLKEVVDGLNRMIGAFIESYREGGLVAQIFDAITIAVEVVGQAFDTVVEIVKVVWDAISELASEIMQAIGGDSTNSVNLLKVTWNQLRDVVVIAKDVIIGCVLVIELMIQELVGIVKAAGQAIYQALTGDWGSIQATWDSNLNALADKTAATAAKISHYAAEMRGAMAGIKTGEGPNSAPWWGGKSGGVEEPKAGGGFNPDLTKGGGHHHKGHKDSIATKLEEELEAKKTAWAMEQDAQGTYQQFSLQSEADFWSQALKRTDLSAKDRLAVEKKFLAARAALLKEKQAQETEDAKQSEALAMEAAQNDIALARVALQEKLQVIDEQERANQLSSTRAAKARADLNRQLYELDQDLETRTFAIKLKALRQELAILGQKPEYYARINHQIELLEKQHLDRMTLLNAQADQKIQKDNAAVADAQRKVWQQTTQGFSHNLAQMLTGQQTFMQTVQGMWHSLQDIAARAIENMVQNWLVGLLTKESASAAFHAKQVLHDAKQAAAGAWNAVVHIPIIGPILAPIAAAAAFAGVMAFSAEGGDWQVKEGLYKLHENEMVLPAHLASPLRSMIQGGGANDNTTSTAPSGGSASDAGSGRMGDTHHHHYNIQALDGPSVKRVLMGNLGAVADSSKAAHRQGHFAGMKRA